MNINKFFSKPTKIEIIPYNICSGLMNMSIDHYLASIYPEKSNPIIRFYCWKPFCVSLGIHQKKHILNIQKLKDEGIEAVRRPTGGRAIFHANELTYSIIIAKKNIQHRILYQFMHLIIAKALNAIGYSVSLNITNNRLPALKYSTLDSICFTHSAQTEIQYGGKKVVGSAQKIYKKTILQHGSILIDQQHKKIIDFLMFATNEKNKLLDDLHTKTISLSEIKNKSLMPRIISDAIIKQLEKVENISLIKAGLSEHDIDLAIRQYCYDI